MGEGLTVVLFGDADLEVVTAVEHALEALTVRVVETPAEALVLDDGADCIVAVSVARAEELLEQTDSKPPVPVVVLTDGERAPVGTHDRVRQHRVDDLVTLESRVVDVVLADRERRHMGAERETDPDLTKPRVAYQTLVENIPNGGVALFDRDLRYTWVGGEVFRLVNLDPDDVADKTLRDVHSSAFLDAYGDAYRRVFDGERSSHEFAYDGRVFQLDLLPVHKGSDVIAGMSMTRDVTEDRERERDLLVKTRAMDAAAIGLCLTDPSQPENPLIYVNEGYERMTGYDASEVLGLNPRHLTGPETEPEPRARMREAVENAEPCAVDITNYKKDGTSFVNHVEITPIFDDEGELVHFLGSQVDVTEQYERERTLERQNEQLEQFASVVSHDLRNPLGIVQGRLELTQETGDLSHLDRAEASLDRMSELIADLLTLAREGKTLDPARVEPVSLVAVAHDAWATVETSGATLTVVSDREVEADKSRLLQLFENLFRNCVEHGSTSDDPERDDEGEAEGDVERETEGEVERETENNPRVEIRIGALSSGCGFFVEDDGPGIPAEMHDQVFDAGVTTDSTGTGFGLAIVRSVAEAHGWGVRVTDGETGGARFEFSMRCLGDGGD